VSRHLFRSEDIKVSNADSSMHRYNKPGELCIRGPTVVRGYLDNPQANARDFDHEGYFHTGDILYCDKDSKLWYIIDRKKVCLNLTISNL
jgi:4-coumarate--CoA ligase